MSTDTAGAAAVVAAVEQFSVDAALVVLAVAFLAALVRVARGPTAADRVVGADLSFFILVGVVALVGARLDAPSYLDVVLVAAVVGFISALALARLVDRE